MCYWYAHSYNCKHVTYALGKYCTTGGLVQKPCQKKSIWQTIRMGEDCEECAVPEVSIGAAEVKTKKVVRKFSRGRKR
jgi:hypothetical protein